MARLQRINSKPNRRDDEEEVPNSQSPNSGHGNSSTKNAKEAPNLFLNLRPPNQSGRRELYIFATIGTILQVAVLVTSGLTSHRFQEITGIAPYAYPLAAAGAICVVVGMLMCSFIVEQRTKEEVWAVNVKNVKQEEERIMGDHKNRPIRIDLETEWKRIVPDDNDRRIGLLWLQKGMIRFSTDTRFLHRARADASLPLACQHPCSKSLVIRSQHRRKTL